MRKKVIAGLAAVMALGLFTGCGAVGGKDIGRDAALEAALEDAGVSESDTTRLKVSEDNDDGRKIYEIQFDAGEKEYDYEVSASDGKILSADVELINNGTSAQNSGTQSSTGTQDTGTQGSTSGGQADSGTAQNQQSQTGTNSADVAVTLEEATAIALERVPGATESDIRIQLDRDDGVYKYEGDIIHEQREYDFEIDANTGTILEWSEERA